MDTVDISPRVYKPAGALTGLVPKYGSVQTTDNTATVILAFPLSEGESIKIDASLAGSQSDLSDATSSNLEIVAVRASAGNVTVKGTSGNRIIESAASTDVTIVANTTDQQVEIKVTGITSETWNWRAFARYYKF